MFSWYQKRECTFIIIAIIAVTGEIERSAAAWSQTSIDIPEEPHSAACEIYVMCDIVGLKAVGNTGYEMAKPPGATDSQK